MYCELPPSRICSPSRTIRPPCTRALNVALRPHQQIVLISSIQAANEKLEQNTELIRAVVREHAAIAQTEEEYHHKYDPLMAEHEAISARLDGYLAERARKIERGKQLRAFLAALRKAPDSLLEWDEQVWLLMVDHATVFPNGSVCFTFKDGTEITA